jgi:hypothetical protein
LGEKRITNRKRKIREMLKKRRKLKKKMKKEHRFAFKGEEISFPDCGGYFCRNKIETFEDDQQACPT